MQRTAAIRHAEQYFDSKAFHADLARRVAIATESQIPERGAELNGYLADELTPALNALGFTCKVYPSPVGKSPFLIATRHEGDDRPTLMSYGHGDVIRGLDAQWREGLSPWKLAEEGERIAGSVRDGASVVMLDNHGVLVIGRDVAHAWHQLYFLEQAARVQVLAQSTGRELIRVPEEVARRTRVQWLADDGAAEATFAAEKRLLGL